MLHEVGKRLVSSLNNKVSKSSRFVAMNPEFLSKQLRGFHKHLIWLTVNLSIFGVSSLFLRFGCFYSMFLCSHYLVDEKGYWILRRRTEGNLGKIWKEPRRKFIDEIGAIHETETNCPWLSARESMIKELFTSNKCFNLTLCHRYS